MERNAVMLEETKDTITVPAAFMIRMLTCIHSLRNRRTGDPNANNRDNVGLQLRELDPSNEAQRNSQNPPNLEDVNNETEE